jgi:gluconokinase
MPSAPGVVSVDIGTSSVKGLLCVGPRVEAEAVRDYPLNQPRPGWAEQDPDVLATACLAVIQDLLARASSPPEAVAFSAPMHALMAVDGSGRPLTPLVTWADARAAAIAQRLRSSGGGPDFHARSGTPLHAMLPALKLAWFREQQTEIWRSARMWCGIKEYVVHRLTGRWVVDESIAAATGLYSLRTGSWDAQTLAWTELAASRLPEVVPTVDTVAVLPPGTAAGQHREMRLVIGASDGVLANLGVGAVAPGVWAVSIGSSGAVRATVEGPQLDPAGRLFCYPLAEGLFVVGGPMNNGGIVYRWLRDTMGEPEVSLARLQGGDPYDLLNPLLEQAPPGADGLFFLPYLTGERAPLWDEAVSGMLVGLTLRHGRPHLIRAALEGVCYQLRAIADLLADLAGPAREVRATGGFTRSAAWLRMLADVLGTNLRVPTTEGSAYGAALLGWRALGGLDRLQDAAALVAVASETRFNPAAHALYERGFDLFRRLVEAEAPWMHEVRRFGAV